MYYIIQNGEVSAFFDEVGKGDKQFAVMFVKMHNGLHAIFVAQQAQSCLRL